MRFLNLWEKYEYRSKSKRDNYEISFHTLLLLTHRNQENRKQKQENLYIYISNWAHIYVINNNFDLNLPSSFVCALKLETL